MLGRRSAGLGLALTLGLLAGCGQTPPPPPPPVVEVKPEPQPEPEPEPEEPLIPGKITLPRKGGKWPWNLAAAPAPSEFRPVAISEVTEPVTGLAVSTTAKRAVLFQKVGGTRDGKTRVVLCDTAAGTVLSEWDIKDVLVPLDLSPDGHQILARQQPPNGRNTLILLTITEQNTLKRKAWSPHDSPVVGNELGIGTSSGPNRSDPLLDVKWAGFVGNERIASAAGSGQLRVFDAMTTHQLGTIEAVPCKPTVTPDGTKLLFLSEAGLTLLDPVTGVVTGTRKIDVPAGEKQLAINATATTVVCVAPGRVAFMDLASGQLRDAVIPKLKTSSGGIPRTFGWAGDRFLMADGNLYDPELPCPVWKYGRFDTLTFRGREVWVVIPPESPSRSATVTVRPFVLPQPEVAEAVATGLNNRNMYALRAGDAIRIDVAGLPAKDQPGAQAGLEQRLRVLGYRPDSTSSAVLVASVDPVGTPASAAYIGGTSIPYVRRPARLKLVKDGHELWAQAWVYEPPHSAATSGSNDLKQHFERQGIGNPDYGLFEKAPIPPMLPGPQFPSIGFGQHDFTPDGLRRK